MTTDRDLYARVISEAVDLFDGYDILALILNVRAQDLIAWSEGRQRPPVSVFLRIVDLLRDSPREPADAIA